MAKAKAPNPFTGRWRIVSMSAWGEEFIIFLTGIPTSEPRSPMREGASRGVAVVVGVRMGQSMDVTDGDAVPIDDRLAGYAMT
jgi:hypothetical protein